MIKLKSILEAVEFRNAPLSLPEESVVPDNIDMSGNNVFSSDKNQSIEELEATGNPHEPNSANTLQEPIQQQNTAVVPPSKGLTKEEKKSLLDLVSEFNKYRAALSVAEQMKTVSEKIVYISELTEKYGVNEAGEWFEGVSLDRDMKEIRKYASELQKVSNKCYPEIQKMEDLYERVGLCLEKYFKME